METTKPWKTKEWKEARAKLLKDKCGECGSTEMLVLHHRYRTQTYGEIMWDMMREVIEHYKPIVRELAKVEAIRQHEEYMAMNDVVTLCKSCHYKRHVQAIKLRIKKGG